MKKHQLVEADIAAHEDRIKDLNERFESLVESGQFDSATRHIIQERQARLNECCERFRNLNNANTLLQFLRDIADEESWIKEKKLLVGSDDYGRDLTGVQNLKKKHKLLEAELASCYQSGRTLQNSSKYFVFTIRV